MRTLRLTEVKQLAQGHRIHLEMSSPRTFSEREETVLLGLQLLKKEILSVGQGLRKGDWGLRRHLSGVGEAFPCH